MNLTNALIAAAAFGIISGAQAKASAEPQDAIQLGDKDKKSCNKKAACGGKDGCKEGKKSVINHG